MASKKTAAQGEWTVIAGVSLHLSKDGMNLHVGVTPNGAPGLWNVLAVAAPVEASGAQAVLNSHAHKLVGTFGFGAAIKAAEKYAKAWKPSGDRCGCEEIS